MSVKIKINNDDHRIRIILGTYDLDYKSWSTCFMFERKDVALPKAETLPF